MIYMNGGEYMECFSNLYNALEEGYFTFVNEYHKRPDYLIVHPDTFEKMKADSDVLYFLVFSISMPLYRGINVIESNNQKIDIVQYVLEDGAYVKTLIR